MKLQFRGKSYEAPHIEWDVNEGEVIGKYRGKPLKAHHLREQHRHSQTRPELTYRGVHYIKD